MTLTNGQTNKMKNLCLTVDFAFIAVEKSYVFGIRHYSSLIADAFQCNTTHRHNNPSCKIALSFEPIM